MPIRGLTPVVPKVNLHRRCQAAGSARKVEKPAAPARVLHVLDAGQRLECTQQDAGAGSMDLA